MPKIKIATTIVVGCMLSIIVTSVFGYFDTSAESASAEPATLNSALPTSEELPGFATYKVESGAKGSKRAFTHRKSDGMQLRITVVALPSAAEAQKLCDTLTYPPGGRMPQTSPSGRLIGQKVWMSQYPKGKQPEDAFTLVVLDGRSVTVIQMMLQIGKDRRGFAVSRKFAPADLAFAETLAIGRVTKLAAMGLTSGGPVVRPANPQK